MLARLGLVLILLQVQPTLTSPDIDLNQEPAESELEWSELAVKAPINKEQSWRLEAKRKASGEPCEIPQQVKSTWARRLRCQATGALKTSARVLAQLPSYFDFDQFRRQFKRTYSSPTEFFFRKSIFLRRAYQVFKSRLAFRLGLSGHLEGVNKFSDRSSQELRRMYMLAPPIELRPAGQTEQEYFERLRAAEAARLKSELEAGQEEVRSQASLDESEVGASGPELDFVNLELSAGGAAGEQHEYESVTMIQESKLRKKMQMLFTTTQDLELRRAIEEEISDVKIETFSQTSLESQKCPTKPLPKLNRWKSEDGDYYADNELESDTNSLRRSSKSKEGHLFNVVPNNTSDSNSQEEKYEAPQLDECDQLDWSRHECFHQIYDQGEKCGKCYVMATTSLAEFYKCNENEDKLERRKFSKEFVLECAQKYSPTTILGCLGGSLLDTLKFISLAGVYNIRGWKLKQRSEWKRIKQSGGTLLGLDAKCPLNQYELPFQEWGQIKLNVKPVIVKVNNWLRALREGPFVVSIQMPAQDIESYESGVHDGVGCQNSGNWHAMLLVGYGTSERGQHFWRFRNSWGEGWGEGGHFNLAMEVAGECLAGGVRVVYQSS